MSDNLRISEVYVNQTKGYQFGDSGIYETYTDNKAQLFKSLQKEYGKCASKVYIDTTTGVKTVGWVFEKRMKYEDARNDRSDSFYTREVWVTLH